MGRKKLLLTHVILVAVLSACSSGKSAFEHGNYYEAVITSVNRLRKNDDHEKSRETLRQAYPMAVQFYEDRAKTSLSSNAEFKWTAVVDSYTTINVMYDEIRRCPGALKVIPNPLNYFDKLEEAKRNAAEENYAAGILALRAATRDKAKVAYGLFVKANEFVPGYKDVVKMMETALWNATVKVVMEPIPVAAKNISVSAEFFDDKVSEYLHQGSMNQFVRFFTRKEAQTMKLNPDHIIKIEFDEFVVGQVFMNEKEIKLEKDSVVAGTYVSKTNNTNSNTSTNTNTNTGAGTTAIVAGGTTNSNSNSSGNTAQSGNTGNSGSTQSGNNQSNSGNNQNSGSSGDTQSGNSQNNSGNSGNTQSGNNQSNSGNTGGSTQGNTGNSGNNGNTGGNSDNNSTPEDTVKVTVCHVPPGNETNRHTLVISRSALKAHLAHGDTEGTCEDKKPKDDKKPKKGNAHTSTKQPMLFASSDNDPYKWLAYGLFSPDQEDVDTTKIYMTVKATLYYYKKTTTSKGVLSFKIIDAKTNALLSVEKMPGEYVWISEWATFNGDERALSPEQLQLTKRKEQVPPPAQDLFIGFTAPIYDQVINKIKNFYQNY